MKKTKHQTSHHKEASDVEFARSRLIVIETEFNEAKERSRLARQKRKEAKLMAHEAKQQAKQAKAALADAKKNLAVAERKLTRQNGNHSKIRKNPDAAKAAKP
jgi:hypothetical protein